MHPKKFNMLGIHSFSFLGADSHAFNDQRCFSSVGDIKATFAFPPPLSRLHYVDAAVKFLATSTEPVDPSPSTFDFTTSGQGITSQARFTITLKPVQAHTMRCSDNSHPQQAVPIMSSPYQQPPRTFCDKQRGRSRPRPRRKRDDSIQDRISMLPGLEPDLSSSVTTSSSPVPVPVPGELNVPALHPGYVDAHRRNRTVRLEA